MTADYIKSTSGTAASDTERSYLIGLLPSIKNSKELNDSFLNSFENKLIGGMKSRIETAIGPKNAKFIDLAFTQSETKTSRELKNDVQNESIANTTNIATG